MNGGLTHDRAVVLILVAVVLTDLPVVVALVDACGHGVHVVQCGLFDEVDVGKDTNSFWSASSL